MPVPATVTVRCWNRPRPSTSAPIAANPWFIRRAAGENFWDVRIIRNVRPRSSWIRKVMCCRPNHRPNPVGCGVTSARTASLSSARVSADRSWDVIVSHDAAPSSASNNWITSRNCKPRVSGRLILRKRPTNSWVVPRKPRKKRPKKRPRRLPRPHSRYGYGGWFLREVTDHGSYSDHWFRLPTIPLQNVNNRGTPLHLDTSYRFGSQLSSLPGFIWVLGYNSLPLLKTIAFKELSFRWT